MDQQAAVSRPARLSDTLVFLATYNERGNIEPMLDALLALPGRHDVVVVDDQSTDGTTEVLQSRSAADPRVAAIVRPRKLGVGSAHILGWLYARRFGYQRIVTLDADFSHDPADIPRLLAALDGGADVMIGSRFAPGGRIDYEGYRLFLSRTANYLSRTLLRLPIAEYTTSLRAARLDRVPLGLVETIDNEGYGFFLVQAVRFARSGVKLGEVPIHFYNRVHGSSKIPRFEVVRGGFNLLRLILGAGMVSRETLSRVAVRDCPSCKQPYCVRRPTGGLYCYACSYRGSDPAQ